MITASDIDRLIGELNRIKVDCTNGIGITEDTVLNAFRHICNDSGAYELGSTLRWAGYTWIIVHQTDDCTYLALDHVLYSVPFGDSLHYYESRLADMAMQFERSLPRDAIDTALAVNILGVICKIFVPLERMVNTFDWFKVQEHRICRDGAGTPTSWWTASQCDIGYAWRIDATGNMASGYPGYMYGFRPFVVLPL